jgi:hypothetical protein
MVLGYIFMGQEAFDIGKDLYLGISLALNADTQADIDNAGSYLASGVAKSGVAGVEYAGGKGAAKLASAGCLFFFRKGRKPVNLSRMQVEDLAEGGGYKVLRIGGLERPRLEKATKAKIEAPQPKNSAGEFLDKKGNVIKEPTYGHIEGHENWRILKQADRLGLNQSQVDKFVNAHPHYFEIQEKKFNLSHQGELLGPDPQADLKIFQDMVKFFGLPK